MDDWLQLTATPAGAETATSRADVELSTDGTTVKNVVLERGSTDSWQVNQYDDNPPQVVRDGTTFTVSGTVNDLNDMSNANGPDPAFEVVFACGSDPTK